jgi:hypothetical protein
LLKRSTRSSRPLMPGLSSSANFKNDRRWSSVRRLFKTASSSWRSLMDSRVIEEKLQNPRSNI